MKRYLVALLAGGAVFGTVLGSAAALDVDGGGIQAGVDADLRCDTNGVNVGGWGYEQDDHTIRHVRLEGIDCPEGSEIFTAVLAGDGSVLTTGSLVEVDADGEAFSRFDTPIAPEDIKQLRVTIGAPS